MVTTAEARTQLQSQRQLLQQRQQQIQQVQLRKLTRSEIARQTRESIIQRQLQSKQLESQKRQALETLKPIEKQFETIEIEIKSVEATNPAREKEKRDWEQARRLITEGKELAARDDPGLRKKIQQLKAQGMRSPVIAPKGIETITAYRNVLTGEMIYQSIAPKNVPSYYQPVQVSATTLKRVDLTPQEQLMASLGIQPAIILPPKQVGVIEDIKKPVATVSLPPNARG